MDMANGILRPEFKHRMLTLEESISTDAARTSVGYQKTGDLLTLPYTETEMVNQPYASRIENVNPFNVMAWIGSIDLDPSSDIWKDTSRMPMIPLLQEMVEVLSIQFGTNGKLSGQDKKQTLYNGETLHGQMHEK